MSSSDAPGFDGDAVIPLALAASEMDDVDLGLPEFRDDTEQDDVPSAPDACDDVEDDDQSAF